VLCTAETEGDIKAKERGEKMVYDGGEAKTRWTERREKKG